MAARAPFTPRRLLGRTGFAATRLGIGDVADRAVPLEECVATVRRALDAGLNLVDTAPGYEAGYSEEIVGHALIGRRRSDVFLIDKIDNLHEAVRPQVESSLERLHLPHADLFVFHGVSTLEDWRRIAASGSGMEQLGECVHQGLARFRGISSHHPDVLREAIASGTCDVVLFPVGAGCDIRYETEVLTLARKRGVGTVCFKTWGAGKLLGDTEGYNRPLVRRPRGKISSGGTTGVSGTTGSDGRTGSDAQPAPTLPRMSVEECLHYTFTADPDVALLGMSFPSEQDAAFAAASSFRALSPAEMDGARRRAAAALQGKGAQWWNSTPIEAAR